MSPKRDERDDESDEEEEEGEGDEKRDDEKGRTPPTKIKKSSVVAAENVSYVGGIKISDSRRTTLAYVSVLLSLTGLILGVVLVVNAYQEDR